MSTWKELHDNPRLLAIYKKRTEIIKLVREFFWSQDFMETDVPIAVRFPSQEPYLHFIPITIHDPYGKEKKMYLTTSPEFSLKKLLAAGFQKIFYITKCFRDYEEFGVTHNTEFSMIEWYRAPGTYQDIMDDVEKLFQFIATKLNLTTVQFNNRAVPLMKPWERVTMKELWKEYGGVNLDEYLELASLQRLAAEHGYQVDEKDQYEDVFFKIFLNEIEPHLGLERPTIVYDYPASLCSLSKVCSHDERYSERFELYIGGLEMANAFGELLDPVEQGRRLQEDQALRRKLNKETWEIDPDFIAALAEGIPSAGGIALGIDRMVVLFTGARDINEVIFGSIGDQFGSATN